VGEERLRGIEARQFSGEEKARRADVVVENDGGLELLRERAVALRDKVLRERRPDLDEDKEEDE
ncbi:MAG: hypothetical protein ACRDSJ_08570, partial [Rubrobacteraceae bacterium]